MKTRLAILAAATLAVGGFAYVPSIGAADQGTGQSTGAAPAAGASGASDQTSGAAGGSASANRSGASATANQADSGAIKQVLVQITQAALSGNPSDLSQYVSKDDQQRISGSGQANAQPDQKVATLKQDWQSKFGGQFADASQAYNDQSIQVIAGSDVTSAARTAGAQLGGAGGIGASGTSGTDVGTAVGGSSGTGASGASSNSGSGSQQPSAAGGASASGTSASGSASSGTGASGAGASGTGATAGAGASGTSGASGTGASGTAGASGTGATAGASGSTSGAGLAGSVANAAQNNALVMIAASGSTPAVTARFVNEGGQWKLDIPDTVDAQKIQQNLNQQLGQLEDQKASWPADQNQAAVQATRVVLAALTDAGGAGASGAGATGAGAPGAAGGAQTPSGAGSK